MKIIGNLLFSASEYEFNRVFDIPSILIEPFFGDNSAEAQMVVAKKQPLAEAIILAFEEWKILFTGERMLS